MNTYEEKQEAKKERLLRAAERAEKESDRLFEDAEKKGSVIPLGQPILVGHYSEKGDRNFREKIHRQTVKAFDLSKKAKELREKAEAVGTGGISSDDPDAIRKINARIKELEELQEFMKIVNKLLKKNDFDGLKNIGLTDKQIYELRTPKFGESGYPSYRLQNNSANIRRLKKRLEELEQRKNDITKKLIFGDIEIIDSVEDNRVQIYFPDKPPSTVRNNLKENGFRWSPTNGCWQRMRSDYAIEVAKNIVEGMDEVIQ